MLLVTVFNNINKMVFMEKRNNEICVKMILNKLSRIFFIIKTNQYNKLTPNKLFIAHFKER